LRSSKLRKSGIKHDFLHLLELHNYWLGLKTTDLFQYGDEKLRDLFHDLIDAQLNQRELFAGDKNNSECFKR
jgi:hypothetical protein